MDATPRVAEPAASQARCQAHPDEAALGACARCGTFFCALERKRVDGRDYCASCAARPDVDYLEAFRLKYWGKRDLWAWALGLGGVLNLANGFNGLVTGDGQERLYFVPLLVLGALGICFWFGLRFARMALWVLPILLIAVGAYFNPGWAVGLGILPLLFALAIHRDTRNRLFFKKEVSREALQKAWHLYANNSAARSGVLLSCFGLFFPVFAPFGLMFSLIGLRRVDPEARPPVGRKGQAIAGIIFGAVSILGWGGFLLAFYFFKLDY